MRLWGTPNQSFSQIVKLINAAPLCILATQRPASIADLLLKHDHDMRGHILVCTYTYNIFPFLCTLRSAKLTVKEFRQIVVLCPQLPTHEEFENLRMFPEWYIHIGDPEKRTHLLKAGIKQCDKVVMFNMSQGISGSVPSAQDGFDDAPAIMVAHNVYDMFQRSGVRKTMIVDLERRSNMRFLRPTARKIKSRKRRLLSDTTQDMGQASVFHNACYTPNYAAGRVLSTPMLANVLYSLHFQPSIQKVFKAFCGVLTREDAHLERTHAFTGASVCSIAVPPECAGQSFLHLFQALAQHRGIVPLGLLRDEIDPLLGNRLPFVLTNPPPSLLLRATDLVYVLATRGQFRD